MAIVHYFVLQLFKMRSEYFIFSFWRVHIDEFVWVCAGLLMLDSCDCMYLHLFLLLVLLLFVWSIAVDEEYRFFSVSVSFSLLIHFFLCAWWSGLVWCCISCITCMHASLFSFCPLCDRLLCRLLHLRVLNAFVCFIYPIFLCTSHFYCTILCCRFPFLFLCFVFYCLWFNLSILCFVCKWIKAIVREYCFCGYTLHKSSFDFFSFWSLLFFNISCFGIGVI